MWKKKYTVYLKGGGPKIEPDENPREAQIADEMMKELECPLSHNFMLDPVFVSSGMTFERSLINREIARQRSLSSDATLSTPVTGVDMTGVLTPNLQMRSITAKFVEKYKDVKYKGSTWDNVRLSCEMYEDEQTPERLEERKLEDKKLEESKRMFKLRKQQEQDRIMRENERRLQEQQRVIQQQSARLNILEQREQERERLAREARERLAREERDRLAREAREARNREIGSAEIGRSKIGRRPVESERERFEREEREERERLAREAREARHLRIAREQQRERLEIEERNLRLAREEREEREARNEERERLAREERERLERERERLAIEAEIVREAEREAERERLAIAERNRHLAREAERIREREAAQIAAQEETARLERIAQGNFYKEREPRRRR